LTGTGAPHARVALMVASIKDSSNVAEIIDLRTTWAAGGFAFAAADACMSAFGDVRDHEVAHEADKSLRNLIGKRHHAS